MKTGSVRIQKSKLVCPYFLKKKVNLHACGQCNKSAVHHRSLPIVQVQVTCLNVCKVTRSILAETWKYFLQEPSRRRGNVLQDKMNAWVSGKYSIFTFRFGSHWTHILLF